MGMKEADAWNIEESKTEGSATSSFINTYDLLVSNASKKLVSRNYAGCPFCIETQRPRLLCQGRDSYRSHYPYAHSVLSLPSSPTILIYIDAFCWCLCTTNRFNAFLEHDVQAQQSVEDK